MLLILLTVYRDQAILYQRKLTKWKKCLGTVMMTSWLPSSLFCMISYADGDVSGVAEETWKIVLVQIRVAVDHAVFPAIDLVLAVPPFEKLRTTYLDSRRHGQFGWSRPAILFACLASALTTPVYI